MGDYRDIVKWLSKACGVAPSPDVDHAEEIKRDLGGAPGLGGRRRARGRLLQGRLEEPQEGLRTGAKKEDGEPLLVSLVSAVVSGDTAEIERLVRDERVPVDARIDHIVSDHDAERAPLKKEGGRQARRAARRRSRGLAVGKSSSESNGAETPLLLVAFGNAGSTMTQTIFPNWSKERKKRAARTFDAAAVVRCLVGLGADLEQRTKMDKYGMTPFHLAARGGRLDVMKALASWRRRRREGGFDGSSALGIAVMMNPASTLRRSRAGLRPDQADDYGRGLLDAAISQGFGRQDRCLADLGATGELADAVDLASTHPALAHKAPKSARRSSSASTGSRRARASLRPPAWPRRARDVAERMSRPKPDVGPETFATLLKRVDHASVGELKGLISTAGGTFVGLVEKRSSGTAAGTHRRQARHGGDAEGAD
ncbi:spectrin binding protein [Aureococcus anophagefferens]|uniref:Spectrin binding protein n=1 Tax=Aureococcus anophagefferens TaxID=44056 RepID=A0ABR1FY86_AURAN